jgi:hypothetical protein
MLSNAGVHKHICSIHSSTAPAIQMCHKQPHLTLSSAAVYTPLVSGLPSSAMLKPLHALQTSVCLPPCSRCVPHDLLASSSSVGLLRTACGVSPLGPRSGLLHASSMTRFLALPRISIFLMTDSTAYPCFLADCAQQQKNGLLPQITMHQTPPLVAQLPACCAAVRSDLRSAPSLYLCVEHCWHPATVGTKLVC